MRPIVTNVVWSVCVITMSCAKAAEPVLMPFELCTQVGPGNHVLGGGPDPPQGKEQFWGPCDAAFCQNSLAVTCSRSPWDSDYRPSTLSVKLARLLVTSFNPKQLRLFSANGDEVRRVGLPDDMIPYHAVESPTGTFIVCHSGFRLQWQVSIERH